MTIARREMVDESVVGIYHCRARCVRRAYLCGVSATTENFDHRKGWISERLKFLSEVFAIDVLTYAVMSNHLHLMLRNRPDLVAAWSDAEVATRWLQLYPKRRNKDGQPEKPRADEIATIVDDPGLVALYRQIGQARESTRNPVAARLVAVCQVADVERHRPGPVRYVVHPQLGG